MFRESRAYSGFSVTDQEEARKFYEDVLGCTVQADQMGLMLSFPNGHTVFLYAKDDHVPVAYTVLNFPVDAIDDAVKQLVEKGVTMERYDNMPAPLDDLGVLRGKSVGMGPDIAWFKDPFGNVLSVLEN